MIPKYLIPDGYRYFVAGGFAVCPSLATDIDVWVQAPEQDGDGKGLLGATYNTLRDHLKRWEAAGVIKLEYPTGREEYRAGMGGNNMTSTLVARVTNPSWEHSIHILATTDTPEGVINNFDLSICQVAITDEGQVIRGDNWTPVTAPIRQLAASTRCTDERMNKYKDRFKVEAAKPGLWDRMRGRVPDEFRTSGY